VAWVEGVAQAVAYKVHGEDGEGDGDTGEDDGVLALQEDPEAATEGVGEHRAPLGGGGAGAEAQEGEGGDVQGQHAIIFPGIAIALCVLSVNFIGDGLRDAMDPRRRR